MERSCHNCSPQDRRSPDCFAAESAAAAEGAVELDAAVVESAGAAAVAESAEAVAVAAVAAALVDEVDEMNPDGTGVAAAVDDLDLALNVVAAVATVVAAVAAFVGAATLIAASVADELHAVADIACDWVSRSTHGSVHSVLLEAVEP